MKRFYILAIFTIISTVTLAQSKNEKTRFTPYVSYDKAQQRADSICKLMTLDDKIDIIKGYKKFYIKPFPQFNIPAITLADATQGIRILPDWGGKVMTKSTAFPSPIALAATWNPSLSYNYAQAIGEECRLAGVHVLLGPGFNIYRNAQCGRNFEYFGEDPFLVSRMIEQYVVGMQNTGTMATIKHFLANNTDLDRRLSNSIVSERAIHEIYTPAFKAGIDAGALAVMTSYNLVNGEWAGQSKYVINDLLRTQLGFKGLVVTDWTSVWDAEKIIKSGQDLEMPYGDKLSGTKALIESGKVKIEEVDRMVKSIMTACISMGFYDRPQRDTTMEAKFSDHNKVALQTAREGIVLLKNRNGILPLKDNSKVLLTGSFIDANAIGKGAALVIGYNTVTLRKALTDELKDKITYVNKPSDDELKKAQTIVLSVGTVDGESFDRPFDLPDSVNANIERICNLNPNTIVVVSSGAGINMSSWSNKAAAILYGWYPGQIGQIALAEILSGKTNPSGKLPITIERQFQDSPAFGYVPEGKVVKWPGSKITPGERTGARNLVYDINYKEGVFVGYRWYEHKNIKPLFAFGHGLSYTNFTYSNIKADKSKFNETGTISVSFDLKNSGKVDGAEIAQLYISDKISSEERPVKELKGFQKVFLKKGQTKNITITLNANDFKFWHSQKKSWVLEPGDFELLIGKSVDDIVLKSIVKL